MDVIDSIVNRLCRASHVFINTHTDTCGAATQRFLIFTAKVTLMENKQYRNNLCFSYFHNFILVSFKVVA